MVAFQYDEIGIWSEVKLAIIKEYASAYSTILGGAHQCEARVGLDRALRFPSNLFQQVPLRERAP